ncbi:MAG: 16S rRNA processing protein RimM, partial [Candidatus Cloacimonetes bacterium]|nr:16S rRNA processing protein RimM [Candidatus Cloacimonadota bacterium]
KEEAHELVKAQLMVAEDMLPVLEEDEFYPNQLVNYTVITNDGVFIGKVSDILSTPGQDILIIPNDDKEIMIPFCDEFIKVINHDEKKIMIEPIEGLLNAH